MSRELRTTRIWAVWAVVCFGVTSPERVAPGQETRATTPAGSGPGRTVVIKVIGPDGQSLAGVVSHNLSGFGSATDSPAASAELNALAPALGKTRMVWFAHEAKKLAGVVTISGDSAGPYTAKLGPWAVVTGHLVGKDKKPRTGVVFHVQVSESPFMIDAENFAYWRGPVSSDGSFRIEGIVPGLTTKALVIEPAINYAHLGVPLDLKPGGTIDVGSLVIPTVKIPAGTKGLLESPQRPKALTTAKLDAWKAAAEYRTDFRKEQYDLRWLRIDGPGGTARLVKPDKKGLRFSVPAGLGQGATVVTKFGVGGDFEITGTFEAVSRDRPNVGWGMGPELFVKPPGGWDKFASAGRFLRTSGTVYSLVHGHKEGDATKYDAETVPTEAKAGRFRLVRTGPTLHFQVAEGESAAFLELFATEFGTEPLEFVRLAAVTGGSQKAVEVLWKDLTVRAEALPGFSGPASRPSGFAGRPLWLAVGAFAVCALAAVVWWRAAAQRHGASGVGDGPAAAADVGTKSQRPRLRKGATTPSDAWDELTLSSMEEAAASYAQAHPGSASCGQRCRFQFSLQQGVLHGPFIAWKPIAKEELDGLGSSWDEIREKLVPRFEGSYDRGKRQGTFSFHDDQGRVSTRRYRDGRVAG